MLSGGAGGPGKISRLVVEAGAFSPPDNMRRAMIISSSVEYLKTHRSTLTVTVACHP